MTKFTSFALQYSGFSATSLANTGAQLIITEAGLSNTGGTASLTAAELAALAAGGKTVVGYVNTSVTDSGRAYWNPDWVTPTNADEGDVGVVNQAAPTWLRNNLGGVDFAPEPAGMAAADEAIRVDYRDPDWRAIVVAQAVAVVTAGYGGVFLDDVGQYYQAALFGGTYDPALADSMMSLVIEVAAAIRAINPDAAVIVNSGVYIGGDSTAGAAGLLYQNYQAAINAVLIENSFSAEIDANPNNNYLSTAAAAFPNHSILALESAARGLDVGQLLEFSGTRGILTSVVPTESYDAFVRPPLIGTATANILVGASGFANLIGGLGGNDKISGGALADGLYGHAGADSLYGGAGNDTLSGGVGDDKAYGGAGTDRLHGDAGNDSVVGDAGNDRVYGGDGNDRIYGGLDADNVQGGAGADYLYGGDGKDSLYGGLGGDVLVGGPGNDVLYGGSGADLFMFGPPAGIDKITDFAHGVDRINLHALATNYAELQGALTAAVGYVRLDLTALGGSGEIRFLGSDNVAYFSAADFLF